MSKIDPAYHAEVPQPDDVNTLVWRYMDLAKLLGIVVNQELTLVRVDQLPGKFEGTFPKQAEKAFRGGKDLSRALAEGETRPKVGDLIGARRIARETVTVTSRRRDADGQVIAQEERHAHRTRWVVEKVSFFAERARLARLIRDEQVDLRASVRANPELKSTFLSVRAAEEFAAKSLANPEDRARFLELVKGAMSASIRKGEPLPSTSLRDRPAREAAPRPKDPKREDPTR